MKFIYIFIVVIVLVGAYYFVAGPPNQVMSPSDSEEVTAEAVPENDGAEPVAEEPQAEPEDSLVTTETELGSDIEMEFPIPDADVELDTKEFTLDGFNYGYDVEEIRVQAGDTVTINLTVSDGFHDWVVDEFDAATEKIRAGGLTSVTFVADTPGTYEYYCSVGSHRAQGMVGTLIVE